MAIRFKESDARPIGRDASGVKGISLVHGDTVVGMVVADPAACLLTACATASANERCSGQISRDGPLGRRPKARRTSSRRPPLPGACRGGRRLGGGGKEGENGEGHGGRCYPTQRRGGKGVRDIKTM